jgi:hypothetical protein
MSERSATFLVNMAEHLRRLSNAPIPGGRFFKKGPTMTTEDGMDLFNLVVIVVEREGGGGARKVFNFDAGAAAIVGTVATAIVDGKGGN